MLLVRLRAHPMTRDFRKGFSAAKMEKYLIVEANSKLYPEIAIGWTIDESGNRDIFVLKPNTGSVVPVLDRVLTGIDGAVIKATLAHAEQLPEHDFADAFFSLHLFSSVLASNPRFGSHGRLWRNRKQAAFDLKKLASRDRDETGVRPREIDEVQKIKAEELTCQQLESFSWGYLFPELPYHRNINIRESSFQEFRFAIVEEWSRNADMTLSEYVNRRAADEFSRLKMSGSAWEVFTGWVSYGIRHSAELVASAISQAAEECLGKLNSVERERINFRHGSCPAAGGASIAFLQKLLMTDPEVSNLILEILTGPLTHRDGGKLNRPEEQLCQQMLVLVMAGLEQLQIERHRSRRRHRRIPAAEMAAPPVDACEEDKAGELQLAHSAIDALPEQDRIIFCEYVEGRRPKDIQERHPELKLTAVQISERYRKIAKKLEKQLRAGDEGTS
mgnify:CR=1 FL=1